MGLAEQMVGIKAKTFLMSTVFDLAKKYSFLSTKWPEITTEIIHNAMKSFSPDEKRLEDHTQKFLQWLGFTPVDLGWDQERKILNIYIGTSRIWREDPRENEVSNVVMKSIISSLGANFFPESEIPHVEFIKQNLPPRTQFGFRITKGIEGESFSFSKDISSKQSLGEPITEASTNSEQSNEDQMKPTQSISAEGPSKSSIINAKKRIQLLIEPVLGNGVNKDEIISELYNHTLKLIQQNYNDEYISIINDIGSYNILQVLFKKTSAEGKSEELSKLLGAKFCENLDLGDISPNEAISGIGKMDSKTIDELLFYTKEKHQDEGFCTFVSNIWMEYINKFMTVPFKADVPMCKITSSQMCLYAYNKS